MGSLLPLLRKRHSRDEAQIIGVHSTPYVRHGLTLVELLVVIFILLAVTAAAIPVVLPAIQNRSIREASRLVTSYFAGARDRAMRSGRSTGVLIERFEGLPQMGIVLTEVEVQAPYAGDFVNSRLTMTGGVVAFPEFDTGWVNLIRVGDTVKLNFQGRRYLITDDDSDGDGFTDGDDDKDGSLDMLSWSLGPLTSADPLPRDTPLAGLPFQIFRRPAKTARPPLVLPESIAIDLVFSGDIDQLFAPGLPGDTSPIVVMFSPTGVVDRLYYSVLGNAVAVPRRPRGPIHLLLGRRDKIPLDLNDLDNPETNNLLDLTNLWISIQPQSGHVASTENSPLNDLYSNYPTLDDAIRDARLLANEAHGMGGR